MARLAGLAPQGVPAVRPSTGAGGWAISWARRVAGVPVRGDGLRLALWPDGSFHGLVSSEQVLAPPPAATLPRPTAIVAADRALDRSLSGSRSDLVVAAADLAWIAPNDTFGPRAGDAPAATLRLAWVVRYEPRGALADRLRAVELWIDAGDGSLLGGDLAE